MRILVTDRSRPETEFPKERSQTEFGNEIYTTGKFRIRRAFS
jgi:hypothetical protein